MNQEVIERPALSTAVDDLFRVRAEIKRLTEIETNIKEILTMDGGTTIDGSFVQAYVKTVTPAPTLDHKALIAYLQVSPHVTERFMKAKAPYLMITLKPLEH